MPGLMKDHDRRVPSVQYVLSRHLPVITGWKILFPESMSRRSQNRHDAPRKLETTLRVHATRSKEPPLLVDVDFCCLNTLQSITTIAVASLRTREKMSSTPSSRRRGHSSRNSQSSTPAQPAQATPKSSRQTGNGGAVASSSPLFFQSSPARSGRAGPSHLQSDGMIISSPPRNSSNAGDRETTPRASARPVEGISSPHCICTIVLTPSRIVPCTL